MRASRDYLLDWMSHMLKHPTTKPTRAVLGAVVLIGEERGGVDMLITLITSAGSSTHQSMA